MSYRVNEPAVASETIDGEVVVVNLESGTYYSLREEAAFVWGLVEQGLGADGIVSAVCGAYREDGTGIAAAVERFLATLEQEALVVPGDAADAPGTATALAAPAPGAVFREPAFQKYSDMQDLLLLDPIHEVDETGWPNVKPGA